MRLNERRPMLLLFIFRFYSWIFDNICCCIRFTERCKLFYIFFFFTHLFHKNLATIKKLIFNAFFLLQINGHCQIHLQPSRNLFISFLFRYNCRLLLSLNAQDIDEIKKTAEARSFFEWTSSQVSFTEHSLRSRALCADSCQRKQHQSMYFYPRMYTITCDTRELWNKTCKTSQQICHGPTQQFNSSINDVKMLH